MSRQRLLVVLFATFAAAANTRAQAHPAMAHHGRPTRILADQRVGPYVASVWANGDVGMANVYVVLESKDKATFVSPSRVRVAIAPESGRLVERIYDAHAEPAQSGAEYVSEVTFDRAERWNIRVTIEGPSGGGQLVSRVDAAPDAMQGAFGLVLSSLPFLTMGVVWWRAAVSRRDRGLRAARTDLA